MAPCYQQGRAITDYSTMKLTFTTNIQALAFHVYSNSNSHTLNADYATFLKWSQSFVENFEIRLSNNGKR